ncbi:hypothetical protein Micbo1qcDRAFT_209695 [Microdochium bolleyi]|uniref:Uncharacterized protein n=1 Tax=Microdochium bolleyi TaxID=196109 RepID=A0A136IL90_9PEZI|nr:hypothetical protein Micbo1qcDRAFT_209695 [Microdochium bolleyi]
MGRLARLDTPVAMLTGSEHATDYYGLGVRLGIYFSWLSGWLANTFLSSGISGASDTNTIFLFTLLIAMTVDSNMDKLFQIDGLILMQLCSGTIFGILSVWGYRTRLYREYGPRAIGLFGSYGTHIRLMIGLAVSVFGFWFWTFGLSGRAAVMGPGDGVIPENKEECKILYTWLFVALEADGAIRWVYRVISAGCMLYFGVMVIVSSLAAWFTIDRLAAKSAHLLPSRWAGSAQHHKQRLARPVYVTGFTSTELTHIFIVLRVANLVWLLFSAIMIEFTLNANHIHSVLGKQSDNPLQLPGQLLPFLVGFMSFLRTCYALYIERWVDRDEPPVQLLPLEDADLAIVAPVGNSSTIARHRTAKRAGGAGQYSHVGRGGGDQGRVEPGVIRSVSSYDKAQLDRARWKRYLVAWLPWLSLMQRYDKELMEVGIVRHSVAMSPSYDATAYASVYGGGAERTPTLDHQASLLPKSPGDVSTRDLQSP